MNHEKSDFDVFEAFAVNTRDLLRGTANMHSAHETHEDVDTAIHEIEHIVEHRLKGNVNFMWGIHSPIVIHDPLNLLYSMRAISVENIGKNSYHSIKGLATKNIKKYVENPPDDYSLAKVSKKRKIILRTLYFGFDLLMEGKFNFDPVVSAPSYEDLDEALQALTYAYEESPFPEKPDEEPFRDYLEMVRRNLDD